ncbi:DUF4407 domain-containing protein [Flavobacterium sp. J49]|uniref:DUF4407 domain-containing protein n=1 Tax=Flavobacterium sp. J49 TaxID=2718534 RepID=UPI0015935370|nr:DUF4407 domain-containing protein [Flavobacterium sp. J49]MBF6642149.1 DUF4407 domain-containing protein [Flavobacterium sp. J49]NIC03396.1 DUF4407 domain-containing protein [Flavobacterium sp. J49]
MKALGEKYQDNNMRKPSGLQNFFILCSGADKEIIKDCPTEWNKFAGIGATIFLTACLALLSGAYAMHFVFDNNIVSILFGVFWAIVIFNLDRYIVLSLRKEKIPTQTDIKKETVPNKKEELKSERNRLFWNQIYMASPRFIIALIIALTVSKPIELKMFDKRINKELDAIQRADIASCETEFNDKIEEQNKKLTDIQAQQDNEKANIYSQNPIYVGLIAEIPNIDSKISSLEKEKANNDKEIAKNQYQDQNDLRPVYKTELIDGKPTKVQTGWQPKWKYNQKAIDLQKRNADINKELAPLKLDLTNKNNDKGEIQKTFIAEEAKINAKFDTLRSPIFAEISRLNSDKPTFIARCQQTALASADLPARLEALGNISKFSLNPQNINFLGNSIWWASLIITLLFIVLETAPVVVKLLTKRGPYDEKLDAIEYQIYIDESKKVDMLNREINEYMRLANDAAKLSGSIRLDAEKDKLEVELRNNKELLNKLADYQRDLANIYADAWYQEEKAKALMQAKGMYNQANPTNTVNDKPKIEESFWRQKGSPDKIEYFFRNGSLTDNELLYFENEQLNKGKWNYNSMKDEIEIDLLGNKINYSISEITKDKLKLTDKINNDILEFDRV